MTKFLSKLSRRIVVLFLILVVGSGLLLLDLANHGRVWNVFWSLTGEEKPLAQIRGMVEWAGNFLRPAPDLAPDVPISHTDINPYSINTFLQQEVEVAKREKTLQMIHDAGFTMIRQQFPWADIEVDGRGKFTDSRNDVNGDGQVDTIDAWAKYDNIVDLAEKYHVVIQARLDSPPNWSRANPDAGAFAPPDDFQDFVDYAAAVASHYKGRIHYYQIWNEPNANQEWGNQPVNPEAYTDLLCRTYKALKAVDPDITVIAAALSPTVSLTPENLSDLIFLQRMYDARAKDCFDVMAAQGYGFYSAPTDQRLRPLTLNFARIEYIRDTMVKNGDAAKSLWLSEAAWNPQPEDPSLVTSQYGNFGIVTPEQAARYMPLAYQHAQQEWPWLGSISYWFFKRPSDYEKNQSFYYFRMAEPDFTTLPVYDSMKQFITTQIPVLYPGVYQAEDWRVQVLGDTKMLVDVEGAEFAKAVEIGSTLFEIHGTDVILRLQSDYHSLLGSIGDRPMFVTPASNGIGFQTNWDIPKAISVDAAIDKQDWITVIIHPSIIPKDMRVMFEPGVLVSPDGTDYVPKIRFDSITVVDRTFENVFPYAAAVAIPIGMMLFVVLTALCERKKARQV